MVNIFESRTTSSWSPRCRASARTKCNSTSKTTSSPSPRPTSDKKYHKEILLPAVFAPEKMTHSCHNGILEVKFTNG